MRNNETFMEKSNMMKVKINIPYYIMCCSNNSRCDNFYLIKVNKHYFCLSCNSIFKKNKKVLIKCCKNQMINFYTNNPYCKNCYRLVYS